MAGICILSRALLLFVMASATALGRRVDAESSSCPTIGIQMATPLRVQQGNHPFSVRVKVTNQGSSPATGLAVNINLPVDATLLSNHPPKSDTLDAWTLYDSPWALYWLDVSLAPWKSKTFQVKAMVGKCFDGNMTITASVKPPSTYYCHAATASETIYIKSPRKSDDCAAPVSRLVVECGVPLPAYQNSFPMGSCGTRTTIDPRTFGPDAWTMLHYFAENYPAQPSAQTQEACVNFLNAIPQVLPCTLCGFDFAEFVLNNIENADTFSSACKASVAYDMPCQAPPTACASQSNLINFFLRAHFNVDTLTKPCKQLWSPAQAHEAYAEQQDFCASSIVWGTRSICRAQGEGGCTYVNTTAPCGTIQPTSPSPGPLTAAPTSSPTSSSELMVQCGVPLPPSISDWPVGTCGNRTSADPRVFGPPTWRTLHIFAEHYPVQPLPDVQRGCVNFINALPFLLPCPYSGYGFSQFITANIQYAGTFNAQCMANTTYNMPCTTPEMACASQPALVSFFLRAHHNVDAKIRPCNPLWSRQQSTQAFATRAQFCATCIVNGFYALCRDVTDTYCVNLDTILPCGDIIPHP